MLIVVIDAEKIVYAQEDFMPILEGQSIAQIIVQLKLKLPLVFVALHQPLEKIVLSGEKAILPKLKEAINDQFNVQTVIIDPFWGMQLPAVILQEIKPAMLVSFGLALRVTDDDWN